MSLSQVQINDYDIVDGVPVLSYGENKELKADFLTNAYDDNGDKIEGKKVPVSIQAYGVEINRVFSILNEIGTTWPIPPMNYDKCLAILNAFKNKNKKEFDTYVSDDLLMQIMKVGFEVTQGSPKIIHNGKEYFLGLNALYSYWGKLKEQFVMSKEYSEATKDLPMEWFVSSYENNVLKKNTEEDWVASLERMVNTANTEAKRKTTKLYLGVATYFRNMDYINTLADVLILDDDIIEPGDLFELVKQSFNPKQKKKISIKDVNSMLGETKEEEEEREINISSSNRKKAELTLVLNTTEEGKSIFIDYLSKENNNKVTLKYNAALKNHKIEIINKEAYAKAFVKSEAVPDHPNWSLQTRRESEDRNKDDQLIQYYCLNVQGPDELVTAGKNYTTHLNSMLQMVPLEGVKINCQHTGNARAYYIPRVKDIEKYLDILEVVLSLAGQYKNGKNLRYVMSKVDNAYRKISTNAARERLAIKQGKTFTRVEDLEDTKKIITNEEFVRLMSEDVKKSNNVSYWVEFYCRVGFSYKADITDYTGYFGKSLDYFIRKGDDLKLINLQNYITRINKCATIVNKAWNEQNHKDVEIQWGLIERIIELISTRNFVDTFARKVYFEKTEQVNDCLGPSYALIRIMDGNPFQNLDFELRETDVTSKGKLVKVDNVVQQKTTFHCVLTDIEELQAARIYSNWKFKLIQKLINSSDEPKARVFLTAIKNCFYEWNNNTSDILKLCKRYEESKKGWNVLNADMYNLIKKSEIMFGAAQRFISFKEIYYQGMNFKSLDADGIEEYNNKRKALKNQYNASVLNEEVRKRKERREAEIEKANQKKKAFVGEVFS